jgi:L-threonylcarbamoyladenylate synthase
MNTKCLKSTIENIKFCADLIKNDEVVAFPTETVYGLGASIFSLNAIKKIFTLKNRPNDNPLIAHVHNLESVLEIAKDIPDDFYKLAEKFFPGPLTIILDANEKILPIVNANKMTIAIRMPKNEVALKLIEYAKAPIVAPSANLSGRPSSTSAQHVLEDFNHKIPYILDGGKCEIGIESTVILLKDNPYLLRPGAISSNEIEVILNKKVQKPNEHLANNSPGIKYRHYAPTALVYLKSFSELIDHKFNNPLFLAMDYIDGLQTKKLSRQNIYELFRFADRYNFTEIIIIESDSLKDDDALYNRIKKAIKRK